MVAISAWPSASSTSNSASRRSRGSRPVRTTGRSHGHVAEFAEPRPCSGDRGHGRPAWPQTSPFFHLTPRRKRPLLPSQSVGQGHMPSEGGRGPVDLEGALGPYIPALRRFARGLLHDADASDDLVQDCLTRAISRWHLRGEKGALRPCLFPTPNTLSASARGAAGRGGGPAMSVEDWDKMLPQVDGRRLAEDRLVWRDLMIGLDS